MAPETEQSMYADVNAHPLLMFFFLSLSLSSNNAIHVFRRCHVQQFLAASVYYLAAKIKVCRVRHAHGGKRSRGVPDG